MADPHIQSPMDMLDKLSVLAYRFGLTASAPLVVLLPWCGYSQVLPWLFIATSLCSAFLHIYLKHFRLLLQCSCWCGLILLVLGQEALALGAAFVTLGGLSFKEGFCFSIPGLKGQPLLLAILWGLLMLQFTLAAQVVASLCGLLLFVTAIAKWRMPLHFDIGDKSKYQI